MEHFQKLKSKIIGYCMDFEAFNHNCNIVEKLYRNKGVNEKRFLSVPLKMLKLNHLEKIKTNPFLTIIEEQGGYISGGFLVRELGGSSLEELGDIDVFFYRKNAIQTATLLCAMFGRFRPQTKNIRQYHTQDHLLNLIDDSNIDNSLKLKTQLVNGCLNVELDHHPTDIEEIVDNFDFGICKLFLRDDHIHMHEESVQDFLSCRITITEKSQYSTFARIEKYCRMEHIEYVEGVKNWTYCSEDMKKVDRLTTEQMIECLKAVRYNQYGNEYEISRPWY